MINVGILSSMARIESHILWENYQESIEMLELNAIIVGYDIHSFAYWIIFQKENRQKFQITFKKEFARVNVDTLYQKNFLEILKQTNLSIRGLNLNFFDSGDIDWGSALKLCHLLI
ncbi:hypothetical protein D3C87_80780 [compost metagenome]